MNEKSLFYIKIHIIFLILKRRIEFTYILKKSLNTRTACGEMEHKIYLKWTWPQRLFHMQKVKLCDEIYQNICIVNKKIRIQNSTECKIVHHAERIHTKCIMLGYSNKKGVFNGCVFVCWEIGLPNVDN